jgi:tRNA dimethylallyltransferase
MEEEQPRIVLIGGPTAVGKSSLAMEVAEAIDGEIVSVDSVQIYRGLDIGSAKPSARERARIPHHLIDELDPDEECNVADFVERALEAITEIRRRGRPVIAVGGTNLYVRVLVHGIFDAPPPDASIRERHRQEAEQRGRPYLHEQLARVDPTLAERVHPNDLVRISRGLEVWELTGKPLSEHQREHAFKTPNVDALKVALNRPRKQLYERINQRVDAMIDAGLVDEYRALLQRGYDPQLKPLQSLGYRHIGMHVVDGLALDEAVELMKRDTRRFAKQQISWLRSEKQVRWADARMDRQHFIADLRAFFGGDEPDYVWENPDAAHW